ncbi:hypothetical protein BGU93_18640 [Clostridioides difficile]|nr:hypothetical protein BGU93_18640 [Clostridioides difficile]
MSPEWVEYWRECYDWAVKEIGYQGTDKNIISAGVHADETSLQLPLYYVPITVSEPDKVYAEGAESKDIRSATGRPLLKLGYNGKRTEHHTRDIATPERPTHHARAGTGG